MNARNAFVRSAIAEQTGNSWLLARLRRARPSKEQLAGKLTGAFGLSQTEKLVTDWLLASIDAGHWLGIDTAVVGRPGSEYYCQGNYRLFTEGSNRWVVDNEIMTPLPPLWERLLEKGV